MSALLLAAAEAATAARAIHFSNSGGVRAEQHEQASSIPIRAARRVRQQASKQCDHLSQGGGGGERGRGLREPTHAHRRGNGSQAGREK